MLNQYRPLTEEEIAAGLKEALKVGTERVVDQVGHQGGYYQDEAIHIPLPARLQPVQETLTKVGLGHYLAELEQGMNRAAEVAAPKARKLFIDAIRQMSWQDVKQIYNGPDDAATRYFQNAMTPELKRLMRSVVDDSLAQVGVVQLYERVMDRYRSIPLAPEVNVDLGGYVIQHGIDGMFYYLAKEEAAIRQDPAKRTTEILQRVFGPSNRR
ncbi:MAG: DUF4197 domain-containing protein [Thiohalophilus sp.]|nr:DUF4197 domain-containing protein [Thiohalophilus sp.]